MLSSTPVQQLESYGERYNLHSLTAHLLKDVADARMRAKAAVPFYKRLSKHIPIDRSAQVLGFGCGCGSFPYLLKEAGYQHREGVDRSPEQAATVHNLGLVFANTDNIFYHLTQRVSESSDAVLAFDMVEHMAKEGPFNSLTLFFAY